ncbi:MAG: PIN domain nuclease [Streptomycetaceae bacterium]|nr:MAG: PIN domain nuclease [Streptomycetaceae bacterium]
MEVAGWLIDKSALVRLADSPHAGKLVERINEGQVHRSTITRLEVGYSARSCADLTKAMTSPPLSKMPIEGLTPAIEELAWQSLQLLAKKGQHRAPSLADLMIAATAQLCGLTVLHLDKDFDLISKATGVQVEKLKINQ